MSKRLARQKLKDTLLGFEGGVELEEQAKRVKHTPSGWGEQKEKLAKEFTCNEELKSGVIRDRTNTDIICVLMFIAFMVLMFLSAGMGFSQGNISKLVAGIDHTKSDFCGVKNAANDYTDYPYLYMPMFREESGLTSFLKVIETGFCVKKCPGKEAADLECLNTYPVPLTTGAEGGCANKAVTGTYATRTVLGYCVPRKAGGNVKIIFENMMMELKGGSAGKFFFDIYEASTPVFICIATGFAYCLAFIGLMSLFAEAICWFCVVITQLALIGIPCMFGYKYYGTR